MPQDENYSSKLDRRTFLKTAATTAGVMFIKPSLVHGTAANSAVRVGLLGCGGRGTEDATNLIDTGNARVVALADLFRDQLDAARAHFDQLQRAKDYTDIDASQLFVGPNAYQQIAHSKEVDAIVSLCRVEDVQLPTRVTHLDVRLIDAAGENDNLDFVLLDTVRAVEQLRAEGRTVFLHCVQAYSRTPTISALYGARRDDVDIDTALGDVSAVLRGAHPNYDFRRALSQLCPRGA